MSLENKRARFEYEILDTFTAGMVLEGWEVKSLRAGSANLRAAWVSVRNDEAWLENCSISPWKFSGEIQPERRSRKLLLKKPELKKLIIQEQAKSTTIIPLKIFAKGQTLKCEIAIARGRKKYEKREVLKNRSIKKEARQVMKNFNG